MKTLTIYNDPDTPNPCDWGEWEFHSFNSNHINFKHPEELGIQRDGSSSDIGLASKLRWNTAFVCSCYMHGNTVWSLMGEGPQCRWDSCTVAGLLVWTGKPKELSEDPKTRKEIARGFLEDYTKWCNGTVYGFMIEDEDTLEGPSRGGYFDEEAMFEDIREELHGVDPEDVEVTGEADWLCQYHKWEPEKETVEG